MNNIFLTATHHAQASNLPDPSGPGPHPDPGIPPQGRQHHLERPHRQQHSSGGGQ